MANTEPEHPVILTRGRYGRRRVLWGLGGAVAGSVATALHYDQALLESASKAVEDAAGSGEESDPYHQTFNSGLATELKFSQSGEATLTLTDSHGADGLGVWHRSDDVDDRNPIYTYGFGLGEDVPRYAGTVTMPLVGAIRQADTDFPDNRFKMLGMQGNEISWERTGRVRFLIPNDLMP